MKIITTKKEEQKIRSALGFAHRTNELIQNLGDINYLLEPIWKCLHEREHFFLSKKELMNNIHAIEKHGWEFFVEKCKEQNNSN